MAGFFGFFDFTKPGKGVDKDEPQKHAFFLFWELVWRKLSRLILLNLVYFLITLPILTAIYMIALLKLEAIIGPNIEEVIQYPPFPSVLISLALSMPSFVATALLVISILLYGPATCGLTYVLRNIARQEHAWMSDFFDRAKQNFKQGLVLGIMDAAVVTLLFINITNTVSVADATDMVGFLVTLVRYASVVILALYLMMRNYTYMIAVTFELKIIQIIKNSLLFAILGLWRNLLALVLIVITGILIMIHPIVEFALVPLFMLSFCGFISVFVCYPNIKKYMLDKIAAQEVPEE